MEVHAVLCVGDARTPASDAAPVPVSIKDASINIESVDMDMRDLDASTDSVSIVPPAIAPHVSNVSVGTSATAFPGTASTSRGKVAIRNGSSVTITLCNSDGSGTFELLPKDTLVYPAGGGSVIGYAKVATGTADLQIIELVE